MIKNDKNNITKGQVSRSSSSKPKLKMAPIKKNKAIKKLNNPKRALKTDSKK